MKITREWIHAHKTPRGAWNSQQLAALGIPWPPTEGWIDRAAGTEITAQAAERFERAGKAEGKSMPKGIEEQKLDSIIAIAEAAINEYLADQAYTADLLNHRPTHASRQAVNDRKSVLRCAIKDYISQTKG